MNQVVRFWITVLSFVIVVGCMIYLFLSFLFPDIFSTDRLLRLTATTVAIICIGVFTWSAVFLAEPETPADERQ